MSNATIVASPGEGFGGASQREKSGGSQDDRIEGKSVTKEEQAGIDKLKLEMEEYKARLDVYEAELQEYKAELKEHKAAGRIEEAQHCEGIIQQKEVSIRQKEALIQQLYALIQEKETRKRKNAVDPDDSRRVAKFLKTVPKAAVEGKLVRFKMNLFGQDDTPDALIVRECYREIYRMILERAKNHEGLYTPVVQVTGTPGTGKTVCGIYVVHQLLVESAATVLYLDGYNYETKTGIACLLGPKDSDIVGRACNAGHVFEKKTNDEYWWGTILTETPEGRQLLDFLLEQTNLWCVLDAAKCGINLPEKIRCNLVVFSSPHRGDTANTVKKKQIILYMPLWSREELVAANKLLELGIDETELDDRYAQFGGVARWVLAKNFEAALAFYNQGMARLTAETAHKVLHPFSSDPHSSLFVHIVPRNGLTSNDFGVSTAVVLKHVQMRFALAQHWDMQNLMTVMGCWGLPGIKAEVHELWWHHSLMLGLKNCKLRDLDSVMKRTSDVDVPKLGTPPQIFSHKNMCDIQKLEEGQYCMPLQSNFETIDSWVVMHNPFVDGNNENLCLVQFQMTTAPQHDLLQAGELSVIGKNEELFKVRTWEGKNIYIVFIVQEAWFNKIKKQEWKAANRKTVQNLKGERLGDIRQFALCVPKEAIHKQPVVQSLSSHGISS